MKKYFLALAFFAFFFSTISFATAAAESEQLAEKIQTALKDFGENINIGIFVQDAKTGTVLYEKDVDRYFTPASTQKLFTAYAALQALGPEFRYHTQLFLDYTKIHKGILKDNLYLQFSGDPSLTALQFEQLINSLAEIGLRRIKGKIIIDDTAFDDMKMSPGTAWDDQDYCWGSPISALIINHNCVTATLTPASEAGQPAKLELPNYPQPMQFVNQAITEPATVKNCAIKVKRNDETSYVINGCLKTSAAPYPVEMAVNNPRANVQILLKYLFDKNQIATSGEIEFKKFEMTTKPFASQDSPPLKKLVALMLKDSDNTIADALFKTMGSNYAHEAGSFHNGNRAVRDILAQSLQFKFPKTTLIDGAGSSRYNVLKPQQVVNLLQKIYSSATATDFINSLAVSGVDGTLKDRLKGTTTLGKIHAKTGSETAVTALSGYLETEKKQTLIFSIMINGFTGPGSKYKALEDKLCKILVES
jgi:D-alanyl-D-alanine carboxypeptidase/D-alanyl-D-alanine-endopeptidase (penicillin-binding protein 4)